MNQIKNPKNNNERTTTSEQAQATESLILKSILLLKKRTLRARSDVKEIRGASSCWKAFNIKEIGNKYRFNRNMS